MSHTSLDELVALSNRLGDPANDYVILGEGNTSFLADDGTFWVKASGSQLRTVTRDGFVRVNHARALDMLNTPDLDDEGVRLALLSTKVDGRPDPLPSVETAVHAVCLSSPGVRVVAHTHPTPVNALTCSKLFGDTLRGRLFPDEVVVCGPESVLVGYVDPGFRLALELRTAIGAYAQTYNRAPKLIFLQNHGMIALGSSIREAENITAMAVKSARILLGSFAAQGPNFLSPEHITRIHTRADEHYRQRIIENAR